MAFPLPPSHPLFTRRAFLKAGFLGVAGLAFYSGELERHWIEVTHRDIFLRGLPDAFEGMRIAQLSDIHMDDFTEPFFLHQAIDRINTLHPDAVLLTGDFVTAGGWAEKISHGAAWQCASLLGGLLSKPLYAVLGNHDHDVGAKKVADALTAHGITVLRNACAPIERAGGRIWIAGLDDPLVGHPDPDLAIPQHIRNVPNEPVILMCHGPDYADYLVEHPAGQSVSLMLSGHTHGGQIRLPLVGALVLPPMGRKFIEGWFQLNHMQLYVNRGIGTIGVPFRLDCPPEVSLLTLRAAA